MLSTWEERRMSSFFELCIGTFVLASLTRFTSLLANGVTWLRRCGKNLREGTFSVSNEAVDEFVEGGAGSLGTATWHVQVVSAR